MKPSQANEGRRGIAFHIAQRAAGRDRDVLLRWLPKLSDARQSRVPSIRALAATFSLRVIYVLLKTIWQQAKRVLWDERNWASRFLLIGVVAGVATLGGRNAGLAALGTAIAVPMWVALGASGAFLGTLVEELRKFGHESRP